MGIMTSFNQIESSNSTLLNDCSRVVNSTIDGMPIDDEGWVPVDGVGAPAERRDLDDLDLMAEVTHPVRGSILRRLKQPRTVAQLAELLDVPITRLYHHVNRLADAGLIHVVATRQVAAVTERRYQTVARSFGVATDLLESTDKRELSAALGSLFDVAKLGFQRYVESDEFGIADHADQHSVLSLSAIHLSDERRLELLERLTELANEFVSDLPDDDPGATTLHLFLSVNPEIS